MRYFSLFSGIGGFELGIEKAYQDLGRTSKTSNTKRRWNKSLSTRSDGERWGTYPCCVGYSEIDKYAIQIYQKHFPTHKNYGDATRIVPEELPDFDLLCAGFPCQSFSIAGKRGGFEDTRGTLFFEIVRIARIKKPRYLLLENVKGLLSHDKGNTFATILSALDELGYDCQWCVLNSKNFGVPQNRERVFIIGHIRGIRRPKVFPVGEAMQPPNRQNETRGSGLKCLYDGDFQSHRVYGEEGISPTIPTSGGGHHIPFISYGYKIRRLTPTECERLQGFPDGWTEGISDTQRYRCLGNAVTVNVITEIVYQWGSNENPHN